MRQTIPLNDERLRRPDRIFRYTADHFFQGFLANRHLLPKNDEHCVVTVEAARPGDQQVLAALAPEKPLHTIDIDHLADIPSVESILAGTQVRTARDLPAVRELMMLAFAELPEPETVRHLTGLHSLYAPGLGNRVSIDLADLPATQMRRLAINRWKTNNIPLLERMTNMETLYLELYKEELDPVAKMPGLKMLKIKGPAKGWARLRECPHLVRASFSEVQMANMKKWNTWKELEQLSMTGRGLKSFEGIEACEQLRTLTLANTSMGDLSPFAGLPCLTELSVRVCGEGLDLASIAKVKSLRSLTVDERTDGAVVCFQSLLPLASHQGLETLVLQGVRIGDGNLLPLAQMAGLRRVELGREIGADVDALRAARPDLSIEYQAPAPRRLDLEEMVGRVRINKPDGELTKWWIFEDFTQAVGTSTNYGAESKIKQAVKQRDAKLAKRLEWDTEAGAVGIYAANGDDIRAVAEVINTLLK